MGFIKVFRRETPGKIAFLIPVLNYSKMVFRRVKAGFRVRVKLRKFVYLGDRSRGTRRHTHTRGDTGFTHGPPAGARFPGRTSLTPLAHADLSYSNPVDFIYGKKYRRLKFEKIIKRMVVSGG